MDLIPYTLITLLHTRGRPVLEIGLSGLLLMLLVFDFCEIWTKGGKSVIKEFRADDILDGSSVELLKLGNNMTDSGLSVK